jgi:hypothetical protein
LALRAAPSLEKERAAVLAAHLQRLVGTQEWDVFVERAGEVEQQHLQALAKAPLADVPALQGRIEGIREVLRLPQTLIAHARRP